MRDFGKIFCWYQFYFLKKKELSLIAITYGYTDRLLLSVNDENVIDIIKKLRVISKTFCTNYSLLLQMIKLPLVNIHYFKETTPFVRTQLVIIKDKSVTLG